MKGSLFWRKKILKRQTSQQQMVRNGASIRSCIIGLKVMAILLNGSFYLLMELHREGAQELDQSLSNRG